MFKKSIQILLLSVLFIVACNDEQTQTQQTGPVRLVFNFAVGNTFQYIMDSRMTLIPEIEGKTLSITQAMKLLSTYKVLSAKQNNKNVTVTYTRITMSSGNGVTTNEFDSDDTTNRDPLYYPIAALINKPFNINISELGVSGVEQLYGTDSLSNNIFGDSSLRKMMIQCLNVYPGKAVSIGDKWENNYNSSSGFIHMNLTNSYELKTIDNNIAQIEITGKILPEDSVQNIKGVQNGMMKLDIATGLIINCKITQQLNGTMKFGEKVHSVNANAEISILGSML